MNSMSTTDRSGIMLEVNVEIRQWIMAAEIK